MQEQDFGTRLSLKQKGLGTLVAEGVVLIHCEEAFATLHSSFHLL
jgi:hypothetical protein